MGEERLEGSGWEREPQRVLFDSAWPSAPKGIVTGFNSFCLLYNHNSILPVEELEGLGWERDPQRSVWPSSPKGNYCDWVYFIPVMNDSNTLG